MNRNRLLVIGTLALALGSLSGLFMYKKLPVAPRRTEVAVIVAAKDIQIGTRLEDGDVHLVSFPQSSVPPGALTQKSEVLNRGAVVPISRGQFILPGMLAAGDGLPSLIPPGMRAVSVRVNDAASATGFVQPGTFVDVLATANSASDRQSTTILENVPVIAVGKNIARGATGENLAAPVITLLVSPDDAQRLALVSQGRIQLALRNPRDAQKVYPAIPEAKPKVHKATTVPTAPPYIVVTFRGSKREETKL